MYYHFLLDEDMPKEEALHKAHVDLGISKDILERHIKDWEQHKEIRVSDTCEA